MSVNLDYEAEPFLLWSTELESFVNGGARIVSGVQSWKLFELKLFTLHNSDVILKWKLSGNYP